MDTLVEITNLHQDRGQRRVLKGIDLTIRRGEILGLIGRNGSGKSTLIQALSGFLNPRAGSIRLGGEAYCPESADAARAAGVSIIEQEVTAPTFMTVAQAMYRNTLMNERPAAELTKCAQTILERTEFTLDVQRLVGSLDPAEQAIVEVLRMLAEEAQLVVFDEVSSLLNDIEIAQLHHTARLLRDQGCSVIYVAHRLEEALAICDRIAILRAGVIVKTVESSSTSPDELVWTMLQGPLTEAGRTPRSPSTQAMLSATRIKVGGRVVDADLQIHAGEIVGVIGLRDAGVTELVDALAGRRSSRIETLSIGEEEYRSIAEALHRVAYAGPHTDDPDDKITEALTSGQYFTSEISQLHSAVKVAHMLDVTAASITDPVYTLSGGDRQKVSIATLAATEADIIVLNHPARGVDIEAVGRVYQVIAGLADAGKGVLLASSNVSELLTVCDRVIVMHKGRIVAEFPSAEANEDLVMEWAESGQSGTAPVRAGARPKH